MSKYIDKEETRTMIKEFIPPSMCRDNILSDIDEMQCWDLEEIKKSLKNKKSLEYVTKEAVKKIKEAK